MQVNIHEAKTNLSRLLAQVENGEEIIIAKSGKPIALLTKFTGQEPKRKMGRDAGRFKVPEGFDDPLPEEINDIAAQVKKQEAKQILDQTQEVMQWLALML